MRRLQSLDNVEYRMLLAPFAFVATAAVASMPILPAAMMWHMLGNMRSTVIWGCVIVLLPVIWTLYRCLADTYYWKTDANGITQRSVFRKFSVRWDQVESVEILTGLLGSSAYRINTPKGAVMIPDVGGLSQFTSLVASIRQHLIANGKPDISSLPGSVLSLWYSIPDEAPMQAEWTSTKGVEWLPLAFLWSMLAVFCIVFSAELDTATITMAAVLGVVIVSVTVYTLKNMTVGKYCISGESITVHHKSKSITIPWAKVENASWKNNPNGGLAILIRQSDSKRHILVPYDRKSDDSGRLILSIIRALQSRGIYLTIPRPLRVSNPQPVSVAQDGVTLRPHRMLMLGVPFMLLCVGILPLLPIVAKQHNNDNIWTGAFVLALSVIFGVFAYKYQVCADECGLRKRTIFGSKTISWDEVGAYEKVLRYESEGDVFRVRVKDKRGRVAVQIDSSLFGGSGWDVFVACIDSKLGHLHAEEETEKPWLARPYD